MATTTNYSWTTPDDTDLVKNGASAIRTLGSSIDTTTKNLNPSTTLGDIEYRSSTSNTNTRLAIGSSGQALTVVSGVPAWAASPTSVLTTTGDLLYASAANTLARRAIGSTGDVLTVSGGLPTWATAPTTPKNFSLVNSPSGTSLSSGTTVTVSSISGADQLMIIVASASSDTGSAVISLRFNSDSASNYYVSGMVNTVGATYSAANYTTFQGSATSINLGKMSQLAASSVSGYLFLSGGNSAGIKIWQAAATGSASGSNTQDQYTLGGRYDGSSTISSVSIICSAGNFDGGTIFVYKSA